MWEEVVGMRCAIWRLQRLIGWALCHHILVVGTWSAGVCDAMSIGVIRVVIVAGEHFDVLSKSGQFKQLVVAGKGRWPSKFFFFKSTIYNLVLAMGDTPQRPPPASLGHT